MKSVVSEPHAKTKRRQRVAISRHQRKPILLDTCPVACKSGRSTKKQHRFEHHDKCEYYSENGRLIVYVQEITEPLFESIYRTHHAEGVHQRSEQKQHHKRANIRPA